ncbi:hypothetical protein ID866_9442 [Astraeus odoratus]|nr:hypothetical protein ID866_9442 [Astraeus odoratus]
MVMTLTSTALGKTSINNYKLLQSLKSDT